MVNTTTIKDLVASEVEVSGLYGFGLIQELNDIIKCYSLYEGDDEDLKWEEGWDQDFETTKKNHNFIKELIDKQNRFMFSFTPTFECLTEDDDSTITDTLNKILKYNKFSSKLLKGEKDCSIGKRVAIKVGVDEKKKKIRLRFVNSLEFIYETSEDDAEDINKVIFFYALNDVDVKEDQRIYKQKYEMQNEKCFCEEGIYNGLGEEVKSIRKFSDTGLDFMPVYIIVNEGLSGDLKGQSDVKGLVENQRDYNRLDSGDTDALVKGMYEALYGIDVSLAAAKAIKKAPGQFYDIQTDPSARDEGGKAQIGVLSHTFSYVEALERHLMRAKQGMYGTLDIPQVTPSELQGFITSGKGMKALYWQLIVRCEAKMMEWMPALEWLADVIIQLSKIYKIESIPEKDYKIVISNRYALPDDKETELNQDLMQVRDQVMSKRDFIIKWAEVSPEVADQIIDQIVKEKGLLEENFMGMTGNFGNEE
ncbi:MAG: phage portal protein [Fusobacteriaceae bacterium]